MLVVRVRGESSLLDFRQVVRHCLFLAITILLIACTLVAQDKKEITQLEQGKPIERELAGGATHSYAISLVANQYLNIVVEQKGVDVVVSLFELDGTKVTEIDSPNGTQGPEIIKLVIDKAGAYRLEVTAPDKNAVAGHYAVEVIELRHAVPGDRQFLAAETAYAEGMALIEKEDPTSAHLAVDKFQEALAIYRKLGKRKPEGDALHSLGNTYQVAFEENERALVYYEQALKIWHELKDEVSETITLANVGVALEGLGRYQEALDRYNRGLQLAKVHKMEYERAALLLNAGAVYSKVAAYTNALDYFSQALDFYGTQLPSGKIRSRGGAAFALENIGSTYDYMGEKKKALKSYGQALTYFREMKSVIGEARTLTNIGETYSNAGEYSKALEYLNQALPLKREIANKRSTAITLGAIGEAYSHVNEPNKALEYLNQALTSFRDLAIRDSEARTLYVMARMERDRNDLNKARKLIEMCLTIVETLRAGITNQSLRSSFFAAQQDYYHFYTDLLMRLHKEAPLKGYSGQALSVSERARARALLDSLAEADADIRQGVDPTLLEQERRARRSLNEKAEQQMKLLGAKHSDEQSMAITKEIESETIELQQIETKIRQASPHYAALMQPTPLSISEIQSQVLDRDTFLLEYSLGEERSYLWAVSSTSIESYELPKREVIESVAKRVYELLNARNKRIKDETESQRDERVAHADGEIRSASSALSQMVLAPVVSHLGKKRLLIVADGVLQYIPFAVLPISLKTGAPLGERPLIADHEIISLPSASTLAVLRREVAGRKPALKTVVALGDPVFVKSDERVKRTPTGDNVNAAKEIKTSANQNTVRELQLVEAAEDTGIASEGLNVPRLPGSRKEAEEIVAMVPASESRLALDFDASRAMATSAELSQYRYVHFSTHGFLNSVHPELSGIVFSLVNERGETQDGFLRAHEIYNLKLPAELVVLSACQTGIGKEVKGEGLVSLTRGFMYAGAPRVVVSLWSVSEQGTTELMVRFYREMLKKGLRPAAALRAAQISLMKEKRWASPFYWAPFTLQGEWR